MYLLDTDTVSSYLRGGFPHLESRILSTPFELMLISIITVEEALQGALSLIHNPKRRDGAMRGCELLRKIMADYSTFQFQPYDEQAKQVFKDMSAETKRIGTADCKIAAIAIAKGFTVVTRNVHDFSRIPLVAYEDWTKPQDN